VNDSNVPRVKRGADRTIDLNGGSERLSDRVVRRELSGLDSRFQACIEIAARYSEDDLPSGQVSYLLEIESSGRVRGVDVNVPSGLRVFSLPACVRKALHSHRFPAFDGPMMQAEGSFRVE
jgi:hypothetical protein